MWNARTDTLGYSKHDLQPDEISLLVRSCFRNQKISESLDGAERAARGAQRRAVLRLVVAQGDHPARLPPQDSVRAGDKIRQARGVQVDIDLSLSILFVLFLRMQNVCEVWIKEEPRFAYLLKQPPLLPLPSPLPPPDSLEHSSNSFQCVSPRLHEPIFISNYFHSRLTARNCTKCVCYLSLIHI